MSALACFCSESCSVFVDFDGVEVNAFFNILYAAWYDMSSSQCKREVESSMFVKCLLNVSQAWRKEKERERNEGECLFLNKSHFKSTERTSVKKA